MDPTYTTDDEKLDVMCDFIAAVDLNEEDDEIVCPSKALSILRL